MREQMMKLLVKLQILRDEKAQDLIEYALVAALIALAATAGMGTLANGINASFASISGRLGNAVNGS